MHFPLSRLFRIITRVSVSSCERNARVNMRQDATVMREKLRYLVASTSLFFFIRQIVNLIIHIIIINNVFAHQIIILLLNYTEYIFRNNIKSNVNIFSTDKIVNLSNYALKKVILQL